MVRRSASWSRMLIFAWMDFPDIPLLCLYLYRKKTPGWSSMSASTVKLIFLHDNAAYNLPWKSEAVAQNYIIFSPIQAAKWEITITFKTISFISTKLGI